MSGDCLLGVARMRDRARHHVLVIARRQKKEAPPEGFGAWGLAFFCWHAQMMLLLLSLCFYTQYCCKMASFVSCCL
ncbi:hypothetical protein [Flavobacterium branchiophilum]|uniref:hypothetical protein n=1 Tax=Flavobacterium branchiophilum TaxID=55197 RepID=UPI0011BF81B4|nr:hypothetical protein [Flavobacterium branchiophilum]